MRGAKLSGHTENCEAGEDSGERGSCEGALGEFREVVGARVHEAIQTRGGAAIAGGHSGHF